MKVLDAPVLEPTEAEQLFDEVVKTQRTKGRRTYGRGLDWTEGDGPDAKYDWLQMALEEAVDLNQYLCAEICKWRRMTRYLQDALAQPDKVGNPLTLAEYQAAALRTAHDDQSTQELAIRALGLAGEAGEVVEIVKKYLGHGHEFDRDKLNKELGDVLWYVATLADACGLDLAEVAEKNIEKLRQRYPDGFTHEASRNRAD